MKTDPATPLSISIPEDIAAKCDGPDQFQKFDKLFRSVIAVPKAALDKAESKWKRNQAKKRLAGKRS
jgi:hypothetical protein